MKNNNVFDEEFKECIVEVCSNCRFCEQYKKAPLKPVVSLPRATELNDIVAMDLKEYQHNKVWILHLIDLATRFSAARFVYTKQASEVVSKIFEMWISIFGRPRKFMSDNRGEFTSKLSLKLENS